MKMKNSLLALLMMVLTIAPALMGQDAEAPQSASRTLMLLVPAAIAIVFLVRRKRRKRASTE